MELTREQQLWLYDATIRRMLDLEDLKLTGERSYEIAVEMRNLLTITFTEAE